MIDRGSMTESREEKNLRWLITRSVRLRIYPAIAKTISAKEEETHENVKLVCHV
jgi:hypothetical protein